MSEEKIVYDSIGKVNISEEVIAVISSVASTEIKGVHDMCGTLGSGIVELFGKKNYTKGVKVMITDENVKIGVSIVVDFGCKIPDVSLQVQEKVKREVENMTGLTVLAVDVFVDGVHFPKKEENNSKGKKE